MSGSGKMKNSFDDQYKNRNFLHCIDAARELNVDLGWAMSKKRAFLIDKLESIKIELDALLSKFKTISHDGPLAKLAKKIIEQNFLTIRNNKRTLEMELQTCNFACKISQRKIEVARTVPYYRILGLKKDNVTISCPFHHDTNPSFLIKGNFGYCFGCGAKEDSIGAVMRLYETSFAGAIETITNYI